MIAAGDHIPRVLRRVSQLGWWSVLAVLVARHIAITRELLQLSLLLLFMTSFRLLNDFTYQSASYIS